MLLRQVFVSQKILRRCWLVDYQLLAVSLRTQEAGARADARPTL